MTSECGESRSRCGQTNGPAADPECSGAVLAAGLGKRMEPLTVRYLPKPMFPLGGKVPLLENWVRTLVGAGITDLSMNLCVLKDTIRQVFHDGARFGAHLRYLEEDQPSGTLGGVCKQVFGRQARTFPGEPPPQQTPLAGSTIVVPSGDIVTNFGAEQLAEMIAWHRRQGAAATLVLTPIAWERRQDYGTVVLQDPEKRPGLLSLAGPIADFREKDPNSPSNLNNASIYLIESRLLAELDPLRTPADPELAAPFYDFGKHVFPALLGQLDYARLARDSRLMGVQYDGVWFDVGQKRDYLRVNEAVLDQRLRVPLPFEKMDWGYLGRDSQVALSQIDLKPPVVIGNHCRIAAGVQLGPYAVIGDGWTVEAGAAISHSVLWEPYPAPQPAGSEWPQQEPSRQNLQQVAAGVTIHESIVAAGPLQQDVRESTVHINQAGQLVVLPINWTDGGPRA